jgi:hypothetical protein
VGIGTGDLFSSVSGTASAGCFSHPPTLEIVMVSNGLLDVAGGPVAWRRYWAVDPFRSGTPSWGEKCPLADISPVVCP